MLAGMIWFFELYLMSIAKLISDVRYVNSSIYIELISSASQQAK